MCGGNNSWIQPIGLDGGGALKKQARTSTDPIGIFSGEGDYLHQAIGLGKKPVTPEVDNTSPIDEEEASKAAGTQAANARKVLAKRRGTSSLLATGAQSQSLISQGKTTLG